MANKSVKRVHSLVNQIARPYAKAYHGYASKTPTIIMRTGHKGTTLRKLVADRVRLERKHGMILRRGGYKGKRYVYGSHFKQY